VQGQVDDSDSIKQVELYLDWNLRGTVRANPFTFSLETDDIQEGPHILAAMAYTGDGVRSCYAISIVK